MNILNKIVSDQVQRYGSFKTSSHEDAMKAVDILGEGFEITEIKTGYKVSLAESLVSETKNASAAEIEVVKDRLNFLPKHFPKVFMLVERYAMNIANQNLREYKYGNGYWEYCIGGGKAPFLYPTLNCKQVGYRMLDSENYLDISPELAGVIITCQAIECLSLKEGALKEEQEFEIFHDLYHELRNFGYSLAEETDFYTSFHYLMD